MMQHALNMFTVHYTLASSNGFEKVCELRLASPLLKVHMTRKNKSFKKYTHLAMTSRVLISKIHCTLSANQKRVREFNVESHN